MNEEEKNGVQVINTSKMDPRIKVTRRVHPVWEDHQELKRIIKEEKRGKITLTYEDGSTKVIDEPQRFPFPNGLPCFVGKWQYFYEHGEKKIDLIQLVDGIAIEHKFPPYIKWEICSGGTVPECDDAEEKFKTKAEAEERIVKLLLGDDDHADQT